MANFYVAQQDTFNGDGTTPAFATVDGGVGASNDFVNAVSLTPTYGAVAEDTHIHLKAYGSDASLYEWDYDTSVGILNVLVHTITVDMDGAIWGDSTGYFVIGTTASANGVYFNVYNKGRIYGIAFSTNDTGTYAGQNGIAVRGAIMEKFYLYSKTATGNYSHFSFALGGYRTRFIDCYFDFGRTSVSNTVFAVSRGKRLTFEGCVFDLRRLPPNMYTRLFSVGDSYGNCIYNITKGSKVLGAQLVGSYWAVGNAGMGSDFIIDDMHFDVEFPRQIPESWNETKHFYVGGYDGAFGFRYETSRSISVWRQNQNFPTLNALLPDGVTPWSVRVLPATILDDVWATADVTSMKKLSGSVSESKTITVELILNDVFIDPLDSQWWVELAYKDTEGTTHLLSSEGMGTSLTPSLAQWNPLSNGHVPYGVNTYNRYKMVITTPTSVGANTIVSATVYSNKPSITTEDFYFVCPDLTIAGV
jgi:hypothetical protein